MADDTQTQQSAGVATSLPELRFPSGQEIYDAIMLPIEPELTSAQLPRLAETYAKEPPEQMQARQARYDAAFAEYDKRFAAFAAEFNARVHAFQRTAIIAAETSTQADEEQGLSDLSASIASA